MKQFRNLKLVNHTENINKFKLVDTNVDTKLNTYFDKLKKDIKTSEATLEDFFS